MTPWDENGLAFKPHVGVRTPWLHLRPLNTWFHFWSIGSTLAPCSFVSTMDSHPTGSLIPLARPSSHPGLWLCLRFPPLWCNRAPISLWLHYCHLPLSSPTFFLSASVPWADSSALALQTCSVTLCFRPLGSAQVSSSHGSTSIVSPLCFT